MTRDDRRPDALMPIADRSSSGEMLRQRVTPAWLIGFLCLLLLASAAFGWLDVTRKIDRLLHDGWTRLHQRAPPDDVVIAAIDTESLISLGRWPWPRGLQALLFEQLARHGARAVVVDLLYVESSLRAADDERLAEAIARLPVSILPVLVEGGGGRLVEERLPLPALSRRVTDLGHIVLPIDDDGIVRRLPLKAGLGRAHWPTLSLAALAAIDPSAPVLESLPGRREATAVLPYRWAQDHEVLLSFLGPSGAVPRIPAARIVRGEVTEEELAGRIVFVGLTTAGLGDVVPTPVSALERPMPGTELHANTFVALRDGMLVTAMPWWTGAVVALFVLPLTLLVYSRAAPRWGLPGALVGAMLPIALSFLLYRYAQLWYAPLSASVPILASYPLWSRHRLEFVTRFLEREQAKLEPHLPKRDPGDDQALADFFAHASRHLPLAGWRFETERSREAGGRRPPSGREETVLGRWTVQGDDVYSKLYRTPGQLRIDLRIEDPDFAEEMIAYVDSLDRVRARERFERRGGTVERLQGNAERLREQMAWLRGVKVFSETVLEGGPIGFVVWNVAGEWVRGNALVRRMLPTLGERALLVEFVRAIGRDPDAGEHADEDRRRFDALLLDGKPWQVTHECGERALVVSFSAVGARLSRRLVCASVIDVSEIRSAERARAEMVDYLSHDLRSPLCSALAGLGEDPDERLDSERFAPSVTLDEEERAGIVRNIRRSLALMDDLLDIARADSLREERFGPVLLDDVLGNALDELSPQARERRLRLDVRIAEETLWVLGDASSLERAFINVIGNALKYSEPGAEVRVALEREGEEAMLVVDDDGVGIDPAVIGELFTRFRRDARVAGRIRGTGLGLALVARVVDQHGGSVAARSGPGEGTRVTMRLPLERALEVPEPPSEPPRSADARDSDAAPERPEPQTSA